MRKCKHELMKLRVPYNIWINVIGAVLFILISLVGIFFITVGVYADQRAVAESTEFFVKNCGWDGCIKTEYTYSDIETRSDWRDQLCRYLMMGLGVCFIILGIYTWWGYSTKHYWYEDEHC